ncbi:hypothetical protein KEM52_004527 [Ascosphaera acerosa]|nr:hypothetical protein KEM52_004527 [Ascosphaera acerosa]
MDAVREACDYACHAMQHATGAAGASGLRLGLGGLADDAAVRAALLLAAIVAMLVWRTGAVRARLDGQRGKARRAGPASALLDRVRTIAPGLTPLADFHHEAQQPCQIRPFKNKYNLTMALESLDPNELVLMDKTYAQRIRLRQATLAAHPHTVRAVNRNGQPAGSLDDPRVRLAVEELYAFLMAHYLPTRYPTMFRLLQTDEAEQPRLLLHNRVTGAVFPALLDAAVATETALERLNATVDEDLLLLLPQASVPADQAERDEVTPDRADGAAPNARYVLEAYVACFPNGFDPREKLGRLLAHIHAPVPGYRARLERSMDRFFSRVEPGRFVKRVNWTVTHGAPLFALGGTHAGAGEAMRHLARDQLRAGLDDTLVRSERQTLYRLPASKALVFGFHTYTYPLQQLKEEGWGEQIAQAIDGFGAGNAPDMPQYKRVPQWGPAVQEYLRE